MELDFFLNCLDFWGGIGIAVFIRNGKYGLNNKRGHIICEAKFHYISPKASDEKFWKNNLAIFAEAKNNSKGLLSTITGEILLDNQYSWIEISDNNPLIKIYQNDSSKQGLFNFNNKKILVKPIKSLEYKKINNNLLRIKVGIKACLMNYDGEKIIDFTNIINYTLKEIKYFIENNIKNI